MMTELIGSWYLHKMVIQKNVHMCVVFSVIWYVCKAFVSIESSHKSDLFFIQKRNKNFEGSKS